MITKIQYYEYRIAPIELNSTRSTRKYLQKIFLSNRFTYIGEMKIIWKKLSCGKKGESKNCIKTIIRGEKKKVDWKWELERYILGNFRAGKWPKMAEMRTLLECVIKFLGRLDKKKKTTDEKFIFKLYQTFSFASANNFE